MAIDESAPSERSLIAWTEGDSDQSLAEFLKEHVPSKTKRKPGGDAWIWVVAGSRRDSLKSPTSESLEYSKKTLEALVERLEEIEGSTAIPRIKSKTSGPSKKMVKEAASKRCEETLREVGKQWRSGKWMFFEGEDHVDRVFDKLARSVIDGPLSKLRQARCTTIKVATADSVRTTSSSAQQLICVYFEDIWNERHAKEVLECLVKEHGEIPNSAKADLYTMIGLDSNHPSQIRSTLYRPAELYNWEVLREWQSDFFEKNEERRGASKESKTDTKRKYGDDSKRQPVAPEEFWPVMKKKKYVPTADEDSETESEDELPGIKAPESGPQTPRKGRQEPVASIERERIARASRSPDEKVKQTPLLALRAKKRNRFGGLS